jgi:hypothetical protein
MNSFAVNEDQEASQGHTNTFTDTSLHFFYFDLTHQPERQQ